MKINTNDLKKVIQAKLKNYATNVYYEGSLTSPYPRVVYQLTQTTVDSGKTQYQLEVNVMSVAQSSAEVDSLADEIEMGLDEWEYTDAYIALYVYRNARQTIFEQDKTIKRRRLTFELNLYSTEE